MLLADNCAEVYGWMFIHRVTVASFPGQSNPSLWSEDKTNSYVFIPYVAIDTIR